MTDETSSGASCHNHSDRLSGLMLHEQSNAFIGPLNLAFLLHQVTKKTGYLELLELHMTSIGDLRFITS